MKTFLLTSVFAIAGAAASAVRAPTELRAVEPVGSGPSTITVNLWYADGGIYNDSFTSGTTEQFRLDLTIWNDNKFETAYNLVLLSKEIGFDWPYSIERRLQQPYIDTSPGSVKPFRFVEDNATLGAHETTRGWRNAERILVFAPSDAAPTISGTQWIPSSANASVSQLFWNQTLYEENLAKGTPWDTYFVAYSLDSVKYVDNLPPQYGTGY